MHSNRRGSLFGNRPPGPIGWCFWALVLFCTGGFNDAWAQEVPPSAAVAETVCRVDFEGIHTTDKERLASIVRTVPNGPYDPKQIKKDIKNLWEIGGFSQIRVEKWTEDKCGTVVSFVLQEEPRVNKVFIEGNKKFKLEDLSATLQSIKEGTSFYSEPEARAVAKAIRDFYSEKGYPFTQVSYHKQSISRERADVVFYIDEGPRPQLIEVRFRGNRVFSDRVLSKNLLLRAGSPSTKTKYFLSCLLAPLRMNDEGGLLSSECSSIFNLGDPSDPLRPGNYQTKLLEAAQDQLRAFYSDRGYWDAKIGIPELLVSPDQQTLIVTIPIFEGELYRLGKTDIQVKSSPGQAAMLLSDEQKKRLLQKLVRPKTSGEDLPVARADVAENLQKVKNAFADRGYPFVQVGIPTLAQIKDRSSSDPMPKSVDVTYEVKPGPKVYIRRIDVRGNDSTIASVIWRELTVRELQQYSQEAVEKSKERLRRTGFFGRVDIRTEVIPGTNEWVDLIVDVAEQQTGTIQAGGGWSSYEGIMATLQINQRNILGYGSNLSLMGQFSGVRQFFSLDYLDPHFLDSSWLFGVGLYRNQLVQPYINRIVLGAAVSTGYEFVRGLSLRAKYRLEGVTVDQASSFASSFYGTGNIDLSNLPSLNLYRKGILSAARLEMVYENLDFGTGAGAMTQTPSGGMRHNLFIELADRYSGSDISYIRVEGALRFYVPIWKKHLQLRLYAGSGYVWSREAEGVPVFERYFLGGINDVRGFNLFSLGPRIAVPQGYGPIANQSVEWFPIGGNLMLRGSAELEFSVFPDLGLRGAVFFDVGNTYNTEDRYCKGAGFVSAGLPEVFSPCATPSVRNLRYAVGVGLRWYAPIGLLRFEWAFPLYNLQSMIGGKPGEQSYMFQFGFGPSF